MSCDDPGNFKSNTTVPVKLNQLLFRVVTGRIIHAVEHCGSWHRLNLRNSHLESTFAEYHLGPHAQFFLSILLSSVRKPHSLRQTVLYRTQEVYLNDRDEGLGTFRWREMLSGGIMLKDRSVNE